MVYEPWMHIRHETLKLADTYTLQSLSGLKKKKKKTCIFLSRGFQKVPKITYKTPWSHVCLKKKKKKL